MGCTDLVIGRRLFASRLFFGSLLLQLGPISDVFYEPFQYEQPTQAKEILLPSFP